MQQAAKFDEDICSAAEAILGLTFSEPSYRQACLTPRLGGLGLRRSVDHADIAFSASWNEAKSECGESWTPRDDLNGGLSQKLGSFRKDEEILKTLVETAPNQRERQRLRRLKCEHAGAWVCAVPSTHDGTDTVMRPRHFQIAVAVRLGRPVLAEEIGCSSCMQTMDVFGDHAACSAKTADLVHRDNRVRNLLDKICHEGMLAPVMEKKNILGDVPGRRPGDVTIPNWRACKGLAIDVAVTCPFSSHNLSCLEPCESYALSKKHAKYDEQFKRSDFEFAAVVFETTGGMTKEAMEVLRQVFRFAAKHQNIPLSVYCGRAWARLACNLQSSMSQAILNRTGGTTAADRDIDNDSNI